ncbi:MAG: hypothetical protein HKN43_03270, partial [Rhodothermales bacterium]|nr:hypothetical protein [Rhodothermales bacterium]
MFTRYWGDTDPSPVWNLMDDFGIDESKMIGYWIDDTPVTADSDIILATTFIRDDRVLVVLASWSEQDEEVGLVVDWSQLGIDPQDARITIAQVDSLQPEERRVAPDNLVVPANQGLFLTIE